MKSKEILKISIDDLLSAFRDSLVSLIPSMERVKIKWRDIDAYDDWDDICDTLYKSIICNSTDSLLENSFGLRKYGIRYNNYINNSFLGACYGKQNYIAFIEYKTILNPFDSMDVAVLDKNLECLSFKTIKNNEISIGLYINYAYFYFGKL